MHSSARYRSPTTEIPAVSAGFRILADGPQAQPEASPVQHPGYRRDGQEGGVDDQVVAAQELAVYRTQYGHVAQRRRSRPLQGQESSLAGKLRGAAALGEPGDAEDCGQPGNQDVERQPRHHVVPPVGDARVAVDQGEQHRGADPRRQPRPRRARERGGGGGGEGRPQHLALQSDVDDAGALREQAGHGGEDQGGGQAQRRIQHQHQEGEEFHVSPRPTAPGPPARRG